jgi:PAS domain S-box-containing protein
MGSDSITARGAAPEQADRGEASEHADAGVRKLFEMTSDLLATISLDGCFILLNPAWEQLLGWRREELQSRPVTDFVHPDDAEQLLGPMRAGAGHSSDLPNFTTRYRHRDGSWHWLLWSARRDGATWYAAAKDITDRM